MYKLTLTVVADFNAGASGCANVTVKYFIEEL